MTEKHANCYSQQQLCGSGLTLKMKNLRNLAMGPLYAQKKYMRPQTRQRYVCVYFPRYDNGSLKADPLTTSSATSNGLTPIILQTSFNLVQSLT